MNYLPIPATSSADEIKRLRKDLDAFYAQTTMYDAFLETSRQVVCWELMLPVIHQWIQRRADLKILEVGAGRTGFPEYLQSQLGGEYSKIRFYAQDVTDQNLDHLNKVTEKVLVGDVSEWVEAEGFDLIFSTHVFEHVTDPHQHLENLLALLKPASGQLFIYCPLYDFPYYINPSARHLSVVKKLVLGAYVLAKRLGTILSGRPAFLIQTNPAVLVMPFFRDSDAIHWVSYFDIRAWAKSKGLRLKSFHRKSPAGLLSKDGMIKALGTLNVLITFPDNRVR